MIQSEGERDDCAEDQGTGEGSVKLHVLQVIGWAGLTVQEVSLFMTSLLCTEK